MSKAKEPIQDFAVHHINDIHGIAEAIEAVTRHMPGQPERGMQRCQK